MFNNLCCQFMIITGVNPSFQIGYREARMFHKMRTWEKMKNYKPTGLWNVEEIEAIYDYSKMILSIAQYARHHQSFVTIEAGKFKCFVKLRGIWP